MLSSSTNSIGLACSNVAKVLKETSLALDNCALESHASGDWRPPKIFEACNNDDFYNSLTPTTQ